jgi:hypothetical protein
MQIATLVPPPLPSKKKDNNNNKNAVVVLIALIVAFVLIFGDNALVLIFGDKSNTSAPKPVVASRVIPSDEASFISIVQEAHRAYSAAGSNELRAGSTRPARAKKLCAAFRGLKVTGWSGVVSQLSTNSDGHGVVVIDIADDVQIGTWNNSVSDSFHHTLLDPESPLYHLALSLQKGSPVKFSGEFFRKDSDCFYESSITMSGSMTQPQFIFHFLQLAPIAN